MTEEVKPKSIESDIKELMGWIKEKGPSPEDEEEVVKLEKKTTQEFVEHKIEQHAPGFKDVHMHQETPSYEDPKVRPKVDQLIQSISQKGLEETIKEVSSTDDFHLVKAFVGMIVDHLYDQLVQAKQLQKPD